MSDTTTDQVRVLPTAKRVRVYLGGLLAVDTTDARLVWEHPYFPTYYFPADELRVKLEPTGDTRTANTLGTPVGFDVIADGTVASGAAVRYLDSPIPELQDLVRLDFEAMDAWFEEDEPIYGHPRDPFHRVDILSSSRHIRVEIAGQTVAESHNPRMLFETGLPARYYLPLTDIRMDLLQPSETKSLCPYKGFAEYWTVRIDRVVYPDVVWIYRAPFPESQKIAGFASFYNEKVDIYVDGVLEARPDSPFS
ncbi:DUF427 domain-containing protein [Nocardia sp. NBC_01503]|uniref:DUF427 domain-containing protein n=1 Tax=Nocardia sp. NBC_01503 TaxID=2975997 RepID=UPI002E7BD6D6|nr:DUF427 domain-containing protein [Nocardia sp. NBC_01503]WTL34284.1 DUF427 domain-containing protein [Nocardia sp. NBC_01503]